MSIETGTIKNSIEKLAKYYEDRVVASMCEALDKIEPGLGKPDQIRDVVKRINGEIADDIFHGAFEMVQPSPDVETACQSVIASNPRAPAAAKRAAEILKVESWAANYATEIGKPITKEDLLAIFDAAAK